MSNKKEKSQQWTGYDAKGNEYHNGFGQTKAIGTVSLQKANPKVKFIHIEKYEPFNDYPDNGLGMSEMEVMHLEKMEGAKYV
jgi:hypothetical protein